MTSADGNLWIVFNGEIYNYIELRSELKALGFDFHTQTDTEVILNAYLAWGVECLGRFNGMWGFAIFDKRQNRLFCARDRFGIKPFYYFQREEKFVFGSEIKSLLAYEGVTPQPNDPILYDYLAYGLIDHTDETFYSGVKQLPPAHYLIFDGSRLNIRRYWDINPKNKLELSDSGEYARRFFEIFEDSIRLHLRSDVAIGSCLSGGLDSSSIVCMANRLLFGGHEISPELVGRQQKTFSSCFDDPRFDERPHIEKVLSATAAEANYTFPSAETLAQELPLLLWHQDEPFGSTSIYAQWRVMKLAAGRGVRVLLDGQGADEMLAGYHPFFNAYWASLASRLRLGKLSGEWAAYRSLYGVSPWRLMRRSLSALAPLFIQQRAAAHKASLGLNPQFARQYGGRHFALPPRLSGGDPFFDQLYLSMTRASLPGLLRYEDRNSMAHSIEARVPFLDYRLVEHIFSLPDDQKIGDGYTKKILRESMKGILPESIRERTDKMGFVTPERLWLSGSLKPWLDDILASASFRNRAYFNAPQIVSLVAKRRAQGGDIGFALWRWLNLELWLQGMGASRSVPPT
jgi:asparagine synthase (glutamine-hydrolysing)